MSKSGGRWITIDETTPSGKVQFKCLECGRTSIAPDKTCLSAGCGFASEEDHRKAVADSERRFRDLMFKLS